MSLQARAPIPILRMCDEAAARTFYVDFLMPAQGRAVRILMPRAALDQWAR